MTTTVASSGAGNAGAGASPRTPREFVDAVFAAVGTALESDAALDGLQAELQKIADGFAGQRPRVGLIKSNAKKRLVYGWASVATKGGEVVEDQQGDVIDDIDNLREVVHDFMGSRVGKAMHEGAQVGTIVDSIVLDRDLQDALGIDLGMEGWFVGYKVTDDAVWDRVEKGELAAFSIGGEGVRTDIPTT